VGPPTGVCLFHQSAHSVFHDAVGDNIIAVGQEARPPRACARLCAVCVLPVLEDGVARLHYVNTTTARKFHELAAVNELHFCGMEPFSWLFCFLIIIHKAIS